MTSAETARNAPPLDDDEPTIAEILSRPDLEGGMPRLCLKVRVPGHPSSISPLVEGVKELLSDAGGLVGREFELETALRESLANAIRHGCKNDASKDVECSIVCYASREIRIVVRDPGPGFDTASVPNPVTAENVSSCHGRGIYMIQQLMDDVWFERSGTEIHMRKRCGH